MAAAAEECPVCLARKALRVTSCKSRHCFCTDCLGLLARKHGTLFPCPMCRQPLQIPRSGMSAFPFQCTQMPGSFNLDSVIARQTHMDSVLALAHDGDRTVAHEGDWLLRSGGAESLAVDGAEDTTSHNEDGMSSFDVSFDYGFIYFGNDYGSQRPQSSNYRDFAVEEGSPNEGQSNIPPTLAVGVATKRSSSLSLRLGGAESLGVDGAEDTASHNEDGMSSFDVTFDYGSIYFGNDYSSQRPQSSNYRDFAVAGDSNNEGQGIIPPTPAVGVATKRSSSLSLRLGGAESLGVDGADDTASHNEDGMSSFDVTFDYGSIYFGSDYSSQRPQSSNYRDFAVAGDFNNEGQGIIPPTPAVGVATKRSSSLSQPGRCGGRKTDRDRQLAERLQAELDRATAQRLDRELNGGGDIRSPHDHLRHLQEDQIRGASRTFQGQAENFRQGALLADQRLARKLQVEEQFERDRVLAKRLQDEEQRVEEQFERDQALAHRLQEEEEQTRQNGLGFNGGLFQGFY